MHNSSGNPISQIGKALTWRGECDIIIKVCVYKSVLSDNSTEKFISIPIERGVL